MGLSSYADVRTALTAFANVSTSDISNANADDLMSVAEDRIYREIRVRDMETVFTSTMTGSGTISLPTGYVELKNAYIDRSPTQWLERKTPEWIYRNYPQRSSSGVPKYIGREASSFIFGPYPDSTYVVKGVYYQKPATVVNDTLRGTLLSNPDLLLFAALVEAERFLGRDRRTAVWEQRFVETLRKVQAEDQMEEFSGSVLAVNPA